MVKAWSRRTQRVAITAGIVAGASIIQWFCWPLVQPAIFLFYFPAVVISSIYGNGILAGWLSTLVAQWLFSPTVELVGLPGQTLRSLIFLASAYMVQSIRNARASALARLIEGQAMLRISESRTRSVLENSIDAVVAMDEQGFVTQWNSQAVATFGYGVDEVFGRKMAELIIPHEHRENHERGLQHYLKSGEGPVLNQRIEITALRKTGEQFPIELAITPITKGRSAEFYAFIRDISDRKAAESRLQAAIRGRDEFISIASHELKTPITSLKLQFQMAARQISSNDARVFLEGAVRKRVDSVNRQLDRMTRLIEDMLDVSRVATGKLHLDHERFDLSALVRESTERFTDQLQMVGSTVERAIEEGVFFVGDEYRTDQVLSNLMTNAIKYGGGKPVRVSLATRGGRILVAVEDHGAGIEERDRARVFERFERAVGSDNVSGLGLGLYISKEIVEALGGKIRLESEVGRGSTFIIELPSITA
jgi:PAS domain S-box-containing protein